ncbi:xylulokinase [Dermatobacter hominis]|uniref:xylulokinase n=1 Tax=Dermatobacter hominis TaxID=2884263 RepID=UPI001D11A21B|nr:xylulokinase [Dermatobacter hominis]UDY34950.1 xylulokinase [Dermatobacter hominis]
MPLVAGVDSSTTACKVEVRDADTGALVASGRAPHPPTMPPRSEQDPRSWWSAFEQAASQAGVSGPNRPSAISIAAQQHGLVALGSAGEVLRPVKLWNDTESADDAAQLVEALGAERWASACGSVPVASFTITKLRWLRRTEPRVFDRLARIGLPHDWLTHRLTGSWTTDRGDASGTGWWSPTDEGYRTDLLGLIDGSVDWLPMLPTVRASTEAAGEWVPTGALVGAGTGDNMAAALGLALRPGDLALSLGTSGTAFTIADAPTADPTGVVAGFADAGGRYLPLVCTLNATKVTDAIARLLGVTTAALDRLALDAPPGADGMVLVPHLDGERTPNRPTATGVLSGIRSDASPALLARAAVEGVVCNLLDGADQLPGADGRVLLVGGGARSEAYRQVVADLTGRPVVVPDEQELVALGAAVQAAAVLHGRTVDEIAAAWGLGGGTTVDPVGHSDREVVRSQYERALSDGARAAR